MIFEDFLIYCSLSQIFFHCHISKEVPVLRSGYFRLRCHCHQTAHCKDANTFKFRNYILDKGSADVLKDARKAAWIWRHSLITSALGLLPPSDNSNAVNNNNNNNNNNK